MYRQDDDTSFRIKHCIKILIQFVQYMHFITKIRNFPNIFLIIKINYTFNISKNFCENSKDFLWILFRIWSSMYVLAWAIFYILKENL